MARRFFLSNNHRTTRFGVPKRFLGAALVACAGCGADVPTPPSPSLTDRPPKVSAPAPTPATTPKQGRDPRADDWFQQEEASRCGVDFVYHNGREAEQYTILETVGGGVALVDFDQDDDLDLFFPGGGYVAAAPLRATGAPPRLYRNEGDFCFTDISAAAGFDQPTDYSHGCVTADFDRDGWPDLFVTCFGRCRLYHNEHGRRFQDVTESSGLVVDGWSTAAAWADVDRDGWPDLYVANYLTWQPGDDRRCDGFKPDSRDVCPPQRYPPAQDRLFRNRGDGRFEEMTKRAGLSDRGKGLGVVAADFDDDGWIDFYVANDAGPNDLYHGGPDWHFEQVGVISATAFNEYGAPEGSMGGDFADYNGDGRGDLFVANFEMEDNSLYRNDGGLFFSHATATARLAGMCRPYVGFGAGFADFDMDGWLDLFVINGNVYYHGQMPFEQPAFLLKNIEGGFFENVSDKGGPYFSASHAGRGAAVGDLNNDGAPDLVIVEIGGTVGVLKNRLTPPHWFRLRLRGAKSNLDALGAKVEIPYQGRQLTRWVTSGSGYLSQFDPRVLAPAASAQALSMTVTWPGGRREIFTGVRPDATVELVEGQGASP